MPSATTDFGPDYSYIPNIIARYESELVDAEANLALKGKTLKLANTEQSRWYAYYDERRVELSIYVKRMEAELDKVRGRLFRKYNENYSRSLSERVIEKYINNEDDYMDGMQLMLLFQEMHDKYEGVVEAFKARGYSLKNLVELEIHDISETYI